MILSSLTLAASWKLGFFTTVSCDCGVQSDSMKAPFETMLPGRVH